MSAIPEGYKELPDSVMSNCDHAINKDVEARLRDSPSYAGYPAWNFYGYVWCDHQRRVYCCEIWVYGTPRKVIEAATLEEIMENASEEFGYD